MIIIFGSLNMDMAIATDRLPQPGETVSCPEYDMLPGGKGGNQALAAHRMGVKTALVGKVGDDGMGMRLMNSLKRQGVMVSGVGQSLDKPTGCAVVVRNSKGESHIISATGANADATADQVPDEILKPGNFVVLQMETPAAENNILIQRAKARGATVILNLSPVRAVPPEILRLVDYLILNEVEAAQTLALFGHQKQADPRLAAQALSRAFGNTCIVTLGAEGSRAALAAGGNIDIPSLPIEDVVDTTGAGDCYCGTLAACLHDKKPLAQAMRYAAVAASLSCREKGAQPSYPYLGDIEDNLKRLP